MKKLKLLGLCLLLALGISFIGAILTWYCPFQTLQSGKLYGSEQIYYMVSADPTSLWYRFGIAIMLPPGNLLATLAIVLTRARVIVK